MLQKSKPIRSQKLRDSARGEECTLQFPVICNGNPETTVLCHLPDESHGMGRKSDDISVAYGCSACHDMIDGRCGNIVLVGADATFRRAQNRTLRRMIEKGLIKIA